MHDMNKENFEYQFMDTIYITAAGTLDSITSKPLEDAIMEKMKTASESLFILDMQHVDFMNSLGLASIIRIWKKADAYGKTLKILTNPKIADIFRISHLDTIIHLYIMEKVPYREK
ncbi:STAS domain-containing protein [bacterium]|nr:STAS domain-containing protein [bacterium]